jgi:tryptophan synthase alpha chain
MKTKPLKTKHRADSDLYELKSDHIGLMGHVVAGYPSFDICGEMIAVMAEAGVRCIELQLPFSEPMADGPILLKANHEALAHGATYARVMKFAREQSRAWPAIKFLLMTYANPVFRRGVAEFAADLAVAGLKGCIVPDLPYDEDEGLIEALTERGLSWVPVVFPNMGAMRIKNILQKPHALVYIAARTGVTGVKTDMGHDQLSFISQIRGLTPSPVAVGFGIGARAQVDFLQGYSNLAVVGSKALSEYITGGMLAYRKLWISLKS